MQLRKIHISNKKSRNTFINFKGIPAKSNAIKVDGDFNPVKNRKVVKASIENTFEGLIKGHEGDLNQLAEDIINSDPELNINIVGKYLAASPRVYVNEEMKVVYRVNKHEKVFNNKGEFIEERIMKHLDSNITEEEPLKWSGKFFPINKIYNKFVFIRTYQLLHDSGLTYDFLYEMAKELEEKDSFLLLGSGSKGKGAVIFQEGGQAYRTFLEGRTKGDKYMLLLHLSNMEFKALENDK